MRKDKNNIFTHFRMQYKTKIILFYKNLHEFPLQYECLWRFHFELLGLRCEMTVMPLEWVLGCDKVVLESISNLGVGGFWPYRGIRLFGLAILWDTMRTLCLHGGNGRRCLWHPTSDRGGGEFLALYKYGLLLTL